MEVLEGNKLIAEFVGAKIEPYPDGHFPGETGYRFKEKMPLNAPDSSDGYWWNKNALHFHDSWDWLIPAWVKFWDVANKMCFDKAVQEPYDQLRNIRVIFMACIDEGDISNAQRILSDGIQWYNSLKK